MNEKFPYGYDLNAYIDKAFEQMKADFPWATRGMTISMSGIARIVVQTFSMWTVKGLSVGWPVTMTGNWKKPIP